MYYSSGFSPFQGQGHLYDYLARQEQNLSEHIRREKEDYILNVSEYKYTQFLFEEFKIESLHIHTQNIQIQEKEEMIRAEDFPRDFHVYTGKSYPKMVIYLHIPVEGNKDLLKYKPSKFILSAPKMTFTNSELVLRMIIFRDSPQEIKREVDSTINYLEKMNSYVNEDVERFNESLLQKAITIFIARKEELLKRRNFLADLNIPIKKQNDSPKTFSIPDPKLRKKIMVKPSVSENSYIPEPTLELGTYKQILQTIHDMGKVLERLPSLYSGKEEEHLRDHFLLMLEPQFQGTATGETFNKKGKTDILLRHENNNVFIAECKFWKGKQSYLKTIDQLFSYLTYRDSKAAIILFVRNKEFSKVIQEIANETPAHKNYLGFDGKEDESWFNYRFHLNGDENREVKLAVMLYHIPKT
jgi:hypothetical protein